MNHKAMIFSGILAYLIPFLSARADTLCNCAPHNGIYETYCYEFGPGHNPDPNGGHWTGQQCGGTTTGGGENFYNKYGTLFLSATAPDLSALTSDASLVGRCTSSWNPYVNSAAGMQLVIDSDESNQAMYVGHPGVSRTMVKSRCTPLRPDSTSNSLFGVCNALTSDSQQFYHTRFSLKQVDGETLVAFLGVPAGTTICLLKLAELEVRLDDIVKTSAAVDLYSGTQIVGHLPKGEMLRIVSIRGDWLRVKKLDETPIVGWIQLTDLERP